MPAKKKDEVGTLGVADAAAEASTRVSASDGWADGAVRKDAVVLPQRDPNVTVAEGAKFQGTKDAVLER